jgi:hypothetical protein
MGMLSVPNFCKHIGISEDQFFKLEKKYPKIFDQMPRILNFPRLDPCIWTPIVTKLLYAPTGKTPAIELPPLNDNTNEEKGNGQPSDVITYGESRATRELYGARTAKLDYLRRAARLVEVSAVRKTWTDIAISVQKSILAVPDRIAPLCVGEQDLTVIRNRMRQELLYALKNLSFTIASVDVVAEPSSSDTQPGTVVVAEMNKKKCGRKKKLDK